MAVLLPVMDVYLDTPLGWGAWETRLRGPVGDGISISAMMRAVLCSVSLAYACQVASSFPAPAAESCAPKTTTAKILRTKSVNDVDPNWAPPAFIGTSWSLIEIKQDGEFLSGTLVSPRGGIQPGRVFVIASEWDCG